MLQLLDQEVENCNSIIGNLLDFAQPRFPDLRPVDLRQLVQKSLARESVPTYIQVETLFDESLPEVVADPNQLTLVFGNIIRNAVQAMPFLPRAAGEGEERLKIAIAQVENGVAITFSDTGEGISPDHLDKVFEPLFTTKPAGIGLGLALSQQLVKIHEGHINVESKEGYGSTFTVWLPARASIQHPNQET